MRILRCHIRTCAALVACAIATAVMPAHATDVDEINLAQLENELAWLINSERTQADLNPLSHDAKLSGVARAHSQEMRDMGYLAHESPVEDHKTPMDRYVNAYGKRPAGLAENVSKLPGVGLRRITSRKVHRAFMNSPEHRANILLQSATQVGIGCAVDADGVVWTTEMFALPAGQAPAEPPTDVGVPPAPGAPPPGAAAPAAPPTPAPAPPPLGDITRPVRVHLWRFEIEPGTMSRLGIPVIFGQSLRWAAASSEGDSLKVFRGPPDELPLKNGIGERSIHDAVPETVWFSGDYELIVTSERQTTCRVIAVVGPQSAVTAYGLAFRAPTPLEPGQLYNASLGDGGFPEVFTFEVGQDDEGMLGARALSGEMKASCAVYSDSERLVARGAVGPTPDGWSLPFKGLAAGTYTLVVNDPQARPGEGDFELRFVTTK